MSATATIKIYGTINEFQAEINAEGTFKIGWTTYDFTLSGITKQGTGTCFNGFDAVQFYNGAYN